MKFIEGWHDGNGQRHVVELTRRNLTVLLAKLDDPLSGRSLLDMDAKIYVKAVEDDDHYADRAPGPMYMPTEDITV